jgi:hypothetical protein
VYGLTTLVASKYNTKKMRSTYSIPKLWSNEKCFLLKGFSIHHAIKLGNGRRSQGLEESYSTTA